MIPFSTEGWRGRPSNEAVRIASVAVGRAAAGGHLYAEPTIPTGACHERAGGGDLSTRPAEPRHKWNSASHRLQCLMYPTGWGWG